MLAIFTSCKLFSFPPCQLIVIVLDINDNAPLFKIPYLASVREDSRNGTVILTVTANDKDAGANGTVVYEIITGNEKGQSLVQVVYCNVMICSLVTLG